MADTIKVHDCGAVYVGNKVSVVEQIVLNDGTRPTFSKSRAFQKGRIVERQFWLARPRVSKPDPLRNPVKYVIIGKCIEY